MRDKSRSKTRHRRNVHRSHQDSFRVTLFGFWFWFGNTSRHQSSQKVWCILMYFISLLKTWSWWQELQRIRPWSGYANRRLGTGRMIEGFVRSSSIHFRLFSLKAHRHRGLSEISNAEMDFPPARKEFDSVGWKVRVLLLWLSWSKALRRLIARCFQGYWMFYFSEPWKRP